MKYKRTILVIDDEPSTIDSLELLFGDEYQCLSASSGEQGLQVLNMESVDLVFLDIGLPGIDGFETLKQIKAHDSSLEVVMLTADDTAKTALRALELGAFHYVPKPYDTEDILLVTRRAFEKKKMSEQILSLKDDVKDLHSFHGIIGNDPKMKKIFEMVEKVAVTDSSVLITGESGTGKELIAQAIHQQSNRKDQPFKAINCGAIPEHLLESELFGHEKGSFTGASERKIGKFEMANHGTLFLDEISSMKETLQVKLLRVLQEQEIERVGGIKSIPIDARIIAATNANMDEIISKGLFREDLFYRINVIHIFLPSLKERKNDALMIAEYFIQFFSKKFGKKITGISKEVQSVILNYAWPGNVRELKNVIERAVVLSDGPVLETKHLPFDCTLKSKHDYKIDSTFSLKKIMDKYEKEVLTNVLEQSGWNQSKAAEILNIHRNTLILKLDSLGIDAKKLKEKASHDRAPSSIS